jgi:hypothetical protein
MGDKRPKRFCSLLFKSRQLNIAQRVFEELDSVVSPKRFQDPNPPITSASRELEQFRLLVLETRKIFGRVIALHAVKHSRLMSTIRRYAGIFPWIDTI